MGSKHKGLRKVARIPIAFALVLGLGFAPFTFAFGDFVPVTEAKVLGVGRIQSSLPDTPVTAENKFALASSEDITEQASELVEPIAKEVAPVNIVEPEQKPLDEAASAATENSNNNGNSGGNPANEDGWISTLATNYGTSGDGFLNQMTASGTFTTTTSMGVAHKSLPLGTVIELYCPATGLSCIATVDDRGPYDGRPDTFDLQMGVTAALGNNTGWYQVLYRIL